MFIMLLVLTPENMKGILKLEGIFSFLEPHFILIIAIADNY